MREEGHFLLVPVFKNAELLGLKIIQISAGIVGDRRNDVDELDIDGYPVLRILRVRYFDRLI